MSSEENNSGVGSNSTSTTTANVKSGNAEIGNVKTGNTEIGRMEWPFSATVLEAVAMFLLVIETLFLCSIPRTTSFPIFVFANNNIKLRCYVCP